MKKMNPQAKPLRNPLYKRLPRELRTHFGKYLALFLFLTVMIGFISGFLVADSSMQRTYQAGFETYRIEDGHIDLASPAPPLLLMQAKSRGLEVTEQFYKDVRLENSHTVRLYGNRSKMNLPALFEGRLPEEANEVALDRLYMQNNGLTVGDSLNIGGRSLNICGSVALSDYSALFKSPSDTLFDSQRFSVALLTNAGFDRIENGDIHYVYAWRSQDGSSAGDEADPTDGEAPEPMSKSLVMNMLKSGRILDIAPREHNQAIVFTGNDFARDKGMILTMLYIVITILGFVFAFTTADTITEESQTIGTLRASGYTVGELFRHYLVLPVLLVLSASLIGNGLGYTYFKELSVRLYYNSYSLPPYVTHWNMEAFILTTLVPGLMVLLIVSLIIRRSLRHSPQQFLRGELQTRKRKRSLRLPDWPIFTRLRLRVLLQNVSSYTVLFIGIYLASLLLFCGLFMTPMLDYNRAKILSAETADYQYILKIPQDTTDPEAELYLMAELEMPSGDTVTVYGLDENSHYLNTPLQDGGAVLISNGLEQKYHLQPGDTIRLMEKHGEETFEWPIETSVDYPSHFTVFMRSERFRECFDGKLDYLHGYFSDRPLEDIPASLIATVIREADRTAFADQMSRSMGKVFKLFSVFAVGMYILLVYLLAGQVLEKNKYSIAMLRVLGYRDRELLSLFHITTGLVLLVSLCISLPLCTVTTKKLMHLIMKDYNGWLFFHAPLRIYPMIFLAGILAYLPAYFLQSKRFRRESLAADLRRSE